MRLSHGHLRWVYASGIVLFASGALWLLFHYFVHVHGEFGERPHALEVWWLRLHGAAAMLVLAVLGSLLPVHIRRGWHQRKNLGAGVTIATLALLLIVSGYALYYFGSEETRPWISTFHWLLGLGAPLLLIWHIVSGRRTRAARPRAAPLRQPPRSGNAENAAHAAQPASDRPPPKASATR
jgi:branched-subunit amino acid ABC-type transport system permease component